MNNLTKNVLRRVSFIIESDYFFTEIGDNALLMQAMLRSVISRQHPSGEVIDNLTSLDESTRKTSDVAIDGTSTQFEMMTHAHLE